MELDPELRPRQPAPQKKPELSRPAPEPDIPVAKPEVLAAREIPPPPRSRIDRILTVLLVLLLAGASFLEMSRDVKTMSGKPPSGEVEYVTDEIVVDLNDNITDAEIAALNGQFGIQLEYNSIHSHAAKLMVAKVKPELSAGIVAGLRASKLVEAAGPNTISVAYAAATWKPNDPEYSRQWHLQMLGLEEAWVDTKGEGAVVAIIDTGFGSPDPSALHPLHDFEQTKLTAGYDFVYKDNVPEDGAGHGNHVAGTIAESTDNGILGAGIAPKATLMVLRVLNEKGRGKESDIADAIRYAADNGANVMNLSLGSNSPGSVEQAALQYAAQKGVLAVCAAGNDGQEGVGYPARFPECLAVSSVGPDKQMAYYSNWGDEIGITAPGGNLRQGPQAGVWQNTIERDQNNRGGGGPLKEGFYALQGTSMASPHVAGVAALLVSLGIKDPVELRTILRKSAADMGAPKQYGAGLLDAAAAVRATGKKPTQKRNVWIVLAVAAGVLLLFVGTGNAFAGLLFLAVGYYLPIFIEKSTHFGAIGNLAGHSVILPVLWLLTPQLSKSSLISAASLAFGLAVHFGLDLDSGASPFQVQSASRISFWFFLNLAIAAYLILSAALRLGAGRKKER